jgi:glycosyltransferase involved in cell wall biosynthesis
MTRPLHVAHVVATVGATGVEAYLYTLLTSFDRSEVEVVLFAPGPGLLVDRLKARGVAVEFGAPRSKWAFGEARALGDRWRGRFDIVHGHGPRASFWAERAARRAGIRRLVLTVHELRWQTLPPGLKRELWIRLEAGTQRRSQRLIAISQATERDLVARFPDLADRIDLVHASTPLLLDADALPRAHPETMGAGPMRLVTVGRFSWQKGYDILLPALAELLRHGVDFRLAVVGHGVLEPELRSQARRLGIDDRIEWLGRDVDLPKLLAGSHAFVAATRAEMFGIAVLEAMAIGLPVLAPAVGSLPEVVADGDSGRLVEFAPEETLPRRMAEVLERWATHPDEAVTLGAGGLRRSRAVYGPAAMARGIAAVYRKMMETSPG